jgi:hypothetical protein
MAKQARCQIQIEDAGIRPKEIGTIFIFTRRWQNTYKRIPTIQSAKFDILPCAGFEAVERSPEGKPRFI